MKAHRKQARQTNAARRRTPARKADVAGVAAVVHRLAVLLAAGVAPAAAWGYLRESELVSQVAASVSRGQSVPDAIIVALESSPPAEEQAWRGLATAWAVATDAGAPLAPTLREFASSLRDLAQAQREIAVALAAPVATARLVMALPLVGILFGVVLGFNTLATLFASPIGWTCLALGGGLMLLAAGWNRRMVRSAQPRDLTPGLQFDLVAIAVSGGGALDRARASVDSSLAHYCPAATTAMATAPTVRDGVDAVLELSQRAGVPAADLLRSEATECRRSARAEVQERAQALSVRLMLPLGTCVLPAFMIVGVVPLVVTVVESTRVSW
jgi:tight adherence protein B